MFRQVVLQHVGAHVHFAPVGDRVQLPAAVAQLQEVDAGAAGRLPAAQPGEPAAHAEFAQRALHRLDLAQPVVVLQPGESLFPQLAVARLHPRAADLPAVDMQVQAQPFGQRVGVLVGFREHVTGVDEQHRQARHRAGEQVQRHRRLHAEAGRQRMRAGQAVARPGDAVLRRQRGQPAVQRGQRLRRFGGGEGIGRGHGGRPCGQAGSARSARRLGGSERGAARREACAGAATMPARCRKSPKPSPGARSPA